MTLFGPDDKKCNFGIKERNKKKILENNGIKCEVIPAKINEEQIKESLLETNATPELISKNLDRIKRQKKLVEKKHGRTRVR